MNSSQGLQIRNSGDNTKSLSDEVDIAVKQTEETHETRVLVQSKKGLPKEETGVRITPLPLSEKRNEATDENTRKEMDVSLNDNDPDDNYRVLCEQCVIRDLVGCDQCGVFVYGYNHKAFKIRVQKVE